MKLLYLTYVWPEAVSSAAGLRSESIIRAILKNGWDLSLASTSEKNIFSEKFEKMGLKCWQVLANNHESLEVLKKQNFDAILYDRFVLEEQFSWRLKEFFPQAAIFVDTQDLHFLRRAREEGIPPLEHPDALREIASILRADLSFVLSKAEICYLEQAKVPEETYQYLPLYYEKSARKNPRSFSQTKNFVFIGNYRHKPNHEAAIFLARIWKDIRYQLPETELHFYGAYMPKEISSLEGNGIKCHGHCENAVETLQGYRWNLAPVLFGAGLKGKIFDGFLAGTPAISTPIGAEGISPFAGEICSREDFAKTCIQLYQNENSWLKFQKEIPGVLENYSQEIYEKELLECIQKTVLALKEIRQKNILGKILWQESYQSKKFLSRWIEAKNKGRS